MAVKVKALRTADQLLVELREGGIVSCDLTTNRWHLGRPDQAAQAPTVYGRALVKALFDTTRPDGLRRREVSRREVDGWLVIRVASERVTTHDGPG